MQLNSNGAKADKLIEEKYEIGKTIGKGTFGKVKMGINKVTKERVAVKMLEKSKIVNTEDLVRVKRELAMISKFSHLNVVKTIEIVESKEYYYIVMEYYETGELFNYIVDKQHLDEDESAFFYYQLINGLEYIHSHSIVHRDLKPENLLLSSQKVLKIIDFGLSNYYNGVFLKTPCGSPCYASPEMVAGKKYNGLYIDVWSTGIILFAMLCGYLPFEDEDNDELFKQILNCRLDYPEHISKRAKGLLMKILVTDPESRIKINEIKLHSFYLYGKELFEARIGQPQTKLKCFVENERLATECNDIASPMTEPSVTPPQSSLIKRIEQVCLVFNPGKPQVYKTEIFNPGDNIIKRSHGTQPRDGNAIIPQEKKRNKTAYDRNPKINITHITPIVSFLESNKQKFNANIRTITEGSLNDYHRPVTEERSERFTTSSNVNQNKSYLPYRIVTKLSDFKNYSSKINHKSHFLVPFSQFNTRKSTKDSKLNYNGFSHLDRNNIAFSYTKSFLEKQNRKEPLNHVSFPTKTRTSLTLCTDYLKLSKAHPKQPDDHLRQYNTKNNCGEDVKRKGFNKFNAYSLYYDLFKQKKASSKAKDFSLKINYKLSEKP